MEYFETIQNKNISWIDIKNPTKETVISLKEKYDFHELDIEDCLSTTERPKIDEYDKYLFLILHFPYFDNKGRLQTEDIKIFTGHNYIITIHRNLSTLDILTEKVKKDLSLQKKCFSRGTGYLLYEIITQLLDDSFPLCDKLENKMKEIEKNVLDEELMHRDMLKHILLLKKNIINFRRLVLPQRTVFAQLGHKNKKFIHESLDVYFDDIVDEIERLWHDLENLKDLTESLQLTNESIISHNINLVMKTLTIFSATMLPLTVITGFYGMNIVSLPKANTPESFFIILSLMLMVMIGMFIFFKLKRWL